MHDASKKITIVRYSIATNVYLHCTRECLPYSPLCGPIRDLRAITVITVRTRGMLGSGPSVGLAAWRGTRRVGPRPAGQDLLPRENVRQGVT